MPRFILWLGSGLALCALRAAPPSVPPGIKFLTGVEYANPDGQHLLLDLALPADTGRLAPAIVCIHGGGFRAGRREIFDKLCLDLAQHGFVAATITYRLAPRYPFPAAVQDAKSAVRWVRAHASEYRVDPGRIGAMGGSAGAHLALFLGVTAGVAEFENDQNPGYSSGVKAVVSFYGPTDFTRSYGHSVDAAEVLPLFLGGNLEQARQRHIEASPLYWVTPAAPPTLLVHGTADKYVQYDQAVWMRDRLSACGVEAKLVTLPDADHGFHKPADAKKAQEALLDFFQSRL